MKKLVVVLIFLFMGCNIMAQKYVYSDRNCKIQILVKYNLKRDSANLNLRLVNEGKLPILTGGVFYAHWTEKHSLLLTFGDEFNIWHRMEYTLAHIKPDSTKSWNFSVKNFFTDSTTTVFGGGYVVSPTLNTDTVLTNRNFTYEDVKKMGFVFYPTYKYNEETKKEKYH